MADTVSKQKRSEIMARVKARNTKPELLVRRVLFSHGFRYRLHDNKIPGCPDIKLPKYKTVIFINGCFWHGHSTCYQTPKTNSQFWDLKIGKNKSRDKANVALLQRLGWQVLIIWECQLKVVKRKQTLDQVLKKLV